ncbi:MAG: type I DNA topoisomerase [Clostridia bacterium]|nr:type I DNA topoisomerase [Clostridia bacterium]
MSKTLIIVESPAKAKTISKFLGKKYTIKASVGHVRDLPKSQFGVDVDNNFEPKYITIRGKGETVKELRAAAKKADKILLAADPDREGEAIAWHLQYLLNIGEKEKCRIEFNEITKNAIVEAVKKPRVIDQNRVDAQQARRVLDRLVGYNLSPLLWRKVKKGLSAGRVQSVAVRLICEREEEINEFNPEEYWTLEADLTASDLGLTIIAKLAKISEKQAKVESKLEMDKILGDLERVQYKVSETIKKEKRRNPNPPFTTSTLQQESYHRLNFTAKKTMRIAQQLYEGIDLGKEGTVGLITYIRTDSKRIATGAQEEAREYIKNEYGVDFSPKEPREFKSKGKVQEAHEAIRPTDVLRKPEIIKEFLSRDQFRLYQLIWNRFMVSQMSSAQLLSTTIVIEAGYYQFRASGSVVVFPGFMKLYTYEDQDEEDKIIPDIPPGMILDKKELMPKQHFTQPPPRFTEATLVKTMEELGIGRPSTYAPTIDTIQTRGYVVREDKQLFPTELGIIVTDLLKEHFNQTIDVEFTAKLEEELDKVEEGTEEWKKVIAEYYNPFHELLVKAEEDIGKIEIQAEVSEEKCELCGKNYVVKMGRYGKFLACPGFPDCRSTKPLLEEIGVDCPKCDGQVVARRSKKGRRFFGCSNFPECNFTTWEQPVNKNCPKCETNLVKKVSKRSGDKLVCPNKSCDFEEEVEGASI